MRFVSVTKFDSWKISRIHPERSDVPSDIIEVADNNCATSCCTPVSSFLVDSENKDHSGCGSIRYPRNSVGNKRRDNGKTASNRVRCSVVPRLDQRLVAPVPRSTRTMRYSSTLQLRSFFEASKFPPGMRRLAVSLSFRSVLPRITSFELR